MNSIGTRFFKQKIVLIIAVVFVFIFFYPLLLQNHALKYMLYSVFLYFFLALYTRPLKTDLKIRIRQKQLIYHPGDRVARCGNAGSLCILWTSSSIK